MTVVFTPDSWDQAATTFDAVQTSADAIWRILEATVVPFVSFSKVDIAIHTSGIKPRNTDIAALLFVANSRRAQESTKLTSTGAAYRATEDAATLGAGSLEAS